jgi:quercetin dioxygenase-like cupin family protein
MSGSRNDRRIGANPVRNLRSILIATAFAAAACSKDSPTATAQSAPRAALASSAAARGDLQWGPAPAVFPPGAEIAVLEGDPSKAEPFTVRLRFPNGYKIPPHTHPTTENVTVLTGTFLAGMGTTFIESDLQALGRDAFASVPANHAHYAMARGLTVVQVHAIGPFILTYVNPADTPKQP